jgi:hypothetical protein
MVKKEPVDTSHAQQPLGKQNDKSPCSGSAPRLAKQVEMSNNSSLTSALQ